MRDNFWIAFGAIATAFMVFLTYRLLKHYRKTDEERIFRETVENVIQPLIRNLESMIEGFKGFSLSEWYSRVSIKDVWQWTKINDEYSFLVYTLPKSIKKAIETFHGKLEKFIYLYNQNIDELNNIIFNEAKGKIGRHTLTFKSTKSVYYEIFIGGKRHQITFHELIFHSKALDEYIETLKKDPKIPNKDIKDESFVLNGLKIDNLNKEDFKEMASCILRKVKNDNKLQEFVVRCRNVCSEAQFLKKDLRQLSNKLE